MLDAYLQHIVMVNLYIFGPKSDLVQILGVFCNTFCQHGSGNHKKTTLKMALQETIKLLQETNPVRLQPSADTVTAQAQTQLM